MEGGKHSLAVGSHEAGCVKHGTTFTWQKSFYDHVIKDDEDFRNHVEYIRYNPVKAGLRQKPEEYPFLFVDEVVVGRILVGG